MNKNFLVVTVVLMAYNILNFTSLLSMKEKIIFSYFIFSLSEFEYEI